MIRAQEELAFIEAEFKRVPFLYIADGVNDKIWILERKSLAVVGAIGQMGRQAGQFRGINSISVDSAGNLYTAEANDGKRIQRFNVVKE